jgi:tRNA-dihydrouridine synthase A
MEPCMAVAPMVDVTNRYFRYLMRLLTTRTTLYTEMINAGAVLENPQFALPYDSSEHPVVFQLGGRDPELLGKAAEACAEAGFDGINLNCGCPSPRVQNASFGAALMLEPELVRQSCYEMVRRVQVPVTVKCRLGVDGQESYDSLRQFISTVSSGGVHHFIVHARTAILTGVKPLDNLRIPPLRYDWVLKLKNDFPELLFSINGGFKQHQDIRDQLDKGLHGVMLGRKIMDDPWFIRNFDSLYYGTPDPGFTRREVILKYGDFVQSLLESPDKPLSISILAKPLIYLFHGERGNNHYRRAFNVLTHDKAYKDNFSELALELTAAMERSNPEALDRPV